MEIGDSHASSRPRRLKFLTNHALSAVLRRLRAIIHSKDADANSTPLRLPADQSAAGRE